MRKDDISINTSQKKYRYAILILTLLVVIFAAVSGWAVWRYGPSGANFNISELKNRYPLLDPAQGIYNKKDLIVDFQPLRDQLNEIGQNQNVSIYFEYLPTGANIVVNRDLALWPASLMKIPIALAVMKKIEKGEWKLTNELVLFNEDKDIRFGNLHKEPTGSRLTIEKLLEEMLTNSDNTARQMFIRNLDLIEVADVIEHLGLEDIFNADKQVTAKKFSIFWRALFVSTYLSPEYSQKLIEIMAKSQFGGYLAKGLPDGITFSHKIGVDAVNNVFSDSGIVYQPDRSYILTVMIQEPDGQKARALMKEISEKIYSYVANY